MAPNGHAAPDQPSADRDARPYTPFKWLERRGSQEFRDWKQVNPATDVFRRVEILESGLWTFALSLCLTCLGRVGHQCRLSTNFLFIVMRF
jgi:hypothetical protein